MLSQQLYLNEKLAEIEAQRGVCKHRLPGEPPRGKKPRMLAPVARAAGRRARRLGEALEAWGTGPSTTATNRG